MHSWPVALFLTCLRMCAQWLTPWLPVSALGGLRAKSFDFRGSYSRNVPARNRTMSLLFKAEPDSLSSAWCAKPFPGRQWACFFSQIHNCLYPWQFYRGLKSLFNWDRNSESFLTSFGKREVYRKAMALLLDLCEQVGHILSHFVLITSYSRDEEKEWWSSGCWGPSRYGRKGFSADHQDGRKARQILGLILKLPKPHGIVLGGEAGRELLSNFILNHTKANYPTKGSY